MQHTTATHAQETNSNKHNRSTTHEKQCYFCNTYFETYFVRWDKETDFTPLPPLPSPLSSPFLYSRFTPPSPPLTLAFSLLSLHPLIIPPSSPLTLASPLPPPIPPSFSSLICLPLHLFPFVSPLLLDRLASSPFSTLHHHSYLSSPALPPSSIVNVSLAIPCKDLAPLNGNF